jgi:hypothetical protein
VQLTGDIYRAASEVIIWLGPSELETHVIMRELQALGGQLLQAGLWTSELSDITL